MSDGSLQEVQEVGTAFNRPKSANILCSHFGISNCTIFVYICIGTQRFLLKLTVDLKQAQP